ncbi:MAG: hypothetical protein JXA44_08190 [Methanospirillaceae archaeon]|nr:hypothetical protein [Methanospirillaceae archaeon]
MQVLRSLLEHCANVDETKRQFEISHFSMPFMGQHFLICDDTGAAVNAHCFLTRGYKETLIAF